MSKIKNRGVKRKLEEQKLDISPVDLLLQKFPVFEEIPAREGWVNYIFIIFKYFIQIFQSYSLFHLSYNFV